MAGKLKISSSFAFLLLMAGEALGCPMCDTENGRQVREGIFNEDFGRTFVTVIAPFPVVFGIVALAYWFPELKTRITTFQRRNS